jgi:hypothetical protein
METNVDATPKREDRAGMEEQVAAPGVCAGVEEQTIGKRLELLELAVIGQASLRLTKAADNAVSGGLRHATVELTYCHMVGGETGNFVDVGPSSVRSQCVPARFSCTEESKEAPVDVFMNTTDSGEHTEVDSAETSETRGASSEVSVMCADRKSEMETFITTRDALAIVAEECEAVYRRSEEKHICEKAELETKVSQLRLDLEDEQRRCHEKSIAVEALLDLVEVWREARERPGWMLRDGTSQGLVVGPAGHVSKEVVGKRVAEERPTKVTFGGKESVVWPSRSSERLPTRAIASFRDALQYTAQSFRATSQRFSPGKSRVPLVHRSCEYGVDACVVRSGVSRSGERSASNQSTAPSPQAERVRPAALYEAPMDMSVFDAELNNSAVTASGDGVETEPARDAHMQIGSDFVCAASAFSEAIENCVAKNSNAVHDIPFRVSHRDCAKKDSSMPSGTNIVAPTESASQIPC